MRYFGSLADAVRENFGSDAVLKERTVVTGGDISRALKITLTDGTRLFLKQNGVSDIGFFEAECLGLHALAETHTIKVPGVYGYGIDEKLSGSFIIMEFLESPKRQADYWEVFGRELAGMHLADTAQFVPARALYGFKEDNYIGASKQQNTPCDSFIEFFRDMRLFPQLKMARSYLDSGLRRRGEYLMGHLEEYLVEPKRPSLLHGDLWGGNFVTGPDGKAWLIDPAVYVGHHEAELAMTELFGALPAAFYAAYSEIYPIDPGYKDRRELYNLYHLLNHLNLFGAGYLSSVRNILLRFGR